MCTGISLTAKDGITIQARTEEWGAFDLQSQLMIIPRGSQFQGETPDGKNGLQWKARYGVLGINALNLPAYIDGMNEKGLAVSVLFLANLAEFEPYEAKLASSSISSLDLTNWLLTSCASIADIRTELPNVKVVPVPLKELGGMATPIHYLISDVSGETIVLEYTKGQRHIYHNPVGVITNNPEFPWHLTNLSNYVGLQTAPHGSVKVGELEVNPFGTVGSGLIGMPGDYSPPSRFVKAAVLRNSVRSLQTAGDAVQEAFRILNNFDIPLGAVDSAAKDIIMGETQWTTAMDTKNLIYYYKTQYNHRIRVIDLKKIDFGTGVLRYVPLDKEHKQDYDYITLQ